MKGIFPWVPRSMVSRATRTVVDNEYDLNAELKVFSEAFQVLPKRVIQDVRISVPYLPKWPTVPSLPGQAARTG